MINYPRHKIISLKHTKEFEHFCFSTANLLFLIKCTVVTFVNSTICISGVQYNVYVLHCLATTQSVIYFRHHIFDPRCPLYPLPLQIKWKDLNRSVIYCSWFLTMSWNKFSSHQALPKIVTGRSGALEVSKGKAFPETHMGRWGSVVWFTDDVQFRGVASWLPNVSYSSVSPGKSPILSSVGPGWRPLPRIYAPH